MEPPRWDFSKRLWRFLLRLTVGIAVCFITYWMMGYPQLMRPGLLLAGLLLIAAVVSLRTGRPLLARFLWGLATPILVMTALFWMTSRPQFWASQISAYQKADQANPPPPGVIVFTGGSSIRQWESLPNDMQPLHVINRGFGGAQLSHVSYYSQRLITAYHPRAVVLYAGDNDLTIPPWKSPQTVLEELEQLVGIIHRELPGTWIFYISMKPAPWGDWPSMDETNRMIAAYLRTQQRVQFIDVSAAMLDAHGRPRRELYDLDPMHMNASGYALWTSIVRPVLLARLGAQ
jgi:lysophospholipase L1-like esterase